MRVYMLPTRQGEARAEEEEQSEIRQKGMVAARQVWQRRQGRLVWGRQAPWLG